MSLWVVNFESIISTSVGAYIFESFPPWLQLISLLHSLFVFIAIYLFIGEIACFLHAAVIQANQLLVNYRDVKHWTLKSWSPHPAKTTPTSKVIWKHLMCTPKLTMKTFWWRVIVSNIAQSVFGTVSYRQT